MTSKRTPRPIGEEDRAGGTIVIVGGNGGLSDRYRSVVEEHGCSMRHYEKSLPAGARRGLGKVALIVIMVTMVSHSLRDQVRRLAHDDAPVVYLRSASISALRGTMEEIAAKQAGVAAGNAVGG